MTNVVTRSGMKLLEGIPLPDGRRVAPSVQEISDIETDAARMERERIYDAISSQRDVDNSFLGNDDIIVGYDNALEVIDGLSLVTQNPRHPSNEY